MRPYPSFSLLPQSESQFPPKSIETSKSCTIHQLPSSSASSSPLNIVVVRNTAHVYPEQLASWDQHLFSRLEYDQSTLDIVVLTTANVINYLEGPASASHSIEPPFIRSLSTRAAAAATSGAAFQRRHLPPPLETPNIIDGVAAQVLSQSQAENMRATAFIVYANARLEAATIEAFAAVLAPGGCLHGVVEENPSMKDFVLKRDRGNLLYT